MSDLERLLERAASRTPPRAYLGGPALTLLVLLLLFALAAGFGVGLMYDELRGSLDLTG